MARRALSTRRMLQSGAILVAFGAIAVTIAFTTRPDPPECTPERQGERIKSFAAPPCLVIDPARSYVAAIETTVGRINLFLNPHVAPRTINNFIFLARHGFYDGTIFHRVEANDEYAFVQGGDPTGTGRGGPGYTFEADPPVGSTEYIRGVVALLNGGDWKQSGSQFFIVVKDYAALGPPNSPPKYPLFAYVTDPESLATLDAMVAAPRDGHKPLVPIRIESVTVKLAPTSERPDAR